MAVVRLSVADVVGGNPSETLMDILQAKGFPVVIDVFGLNQLRPDWTKMKYCRTEYDPKTMEYIYIWEELSE